jgi:hypothetical protein
MWRLLTEFALFLRREKKWWLIPLLLALFALGLLIALGSSAAVSPFLYPFM